MNTPDYRPLITADQTIQPGYVVLTFSSLSKEQASYMTQAWLGRPADNPTDKTPAVETQ